VLVRYLPELLQDNENHVVSDWGSGDRRLTSRELGMRPSDLAAAATVQNCTKGYK
jgi:hypothetical protein